MQDNVIYYITIINNLNIQHTRQYKQENLLRFFKGICYCGLYVGLFMIYISVVNYFDVSLTA